MIKLKNAVLIVYVLVLAGCGTGYGIYHDVAPGETFDGICEAYGINKLSVARINNILDESEVQPGDAIYIPGASSRRSAIAASRHDSGRSFDRKPDIKRPERTEVPQLPEKKEPARKAPVKSVMPASKGKVDFIWPIKGKVLSGFIGSGDHLHDGIDIGSDLGGEVRASSSGRVIYSGNDIEGYGNMVILKHEGAYSSVYAHNSENRVKKGDFVKAGDVIALVGESGRINVPALHFEIRKGKNAVDPMKLLP